jgi:poly(A) polymerase
MQPVVIPRNEHPISRRDIDEHALKVLYRLYRAGHTAYLVGGCIRDLLLGAVPKDFDVATDAHPQRVRKLFKNCVLVGRRFRLAHVRFGSEVIEVSTFRKNPEPGEAAEGGADLLIRSDNTFGTPEDDAKRRDFTINALYYDIGTYSIIDYVGGLRDLEDGFVRSIGDPDVRYQEDPVRMIRACKFAARCDFDIVEEDLAAMAHHRERLKLASIARLLEEVFKLLRSGHAASCLKMLAETHLLEHLLPEVAEHLERTGALEKPEDAEFFRFLFALDDLLGHEDRPSTSNPLLLSALLLPLMCEELRKNGGPRDAWDASPQEIEDAFEAAARPVLRRLTVSRRDSEMLQAALLLQPRLTGSDGPGSKRAQALAQRPGLHLAADVLALGSHVHEDLIDVADEWRDWLADVPTVQVPFTPRRRAGRRRREQAGG